MVPNQRQLFIVVSDWGSYLGCHFHVGFVGYCLCVVACQHSCYMASRSFCSFVSLFDVSLLEDEWILFTLRLGLIVMTDATAVYLCVQGYLKELTYSWFLFVCIFVGLLFLHKISYADKDAGTIEIESLERHPLT